MRWHKRINVGKWIGSRLSFRPVKQISLLWTTQTTVLAIRQVLVEENKLRQTIYGEDQKWVTGRLQIIE